MALQILASKLAKETAIDRQMERRENRRRQVGSGMRGDKIRTYREQDDRVTDHRSGRTWKLKDWRRGQWPKF